MWLASNFKLSKCLQYQLLEMLLTGRHLGDGDTSTEGVGAPVPNFALCLPHKKSNKHHLASIILRYA